MNDKSKKDNKPCVFSWKLYREAYGSKEVSILCSLALQQWHDGHDILDELDEDERKRFADGFKAGFIAGRVVGKAEMEDEA